MDVDAVPAGTGGASDEQDLASPGKEVEGNRGGRVGIDPDGGGRGGHLRCRGRPNGADVQVHPVHRGRGDQDHHRLPLPPRGAEGDRAQVGHRRYGRGRLQLAGSGGAAATAAATPGVSHEGLLDPSLSSVPAVGAILPCGRSPVTRGPVPEVHRPVREGGREDRPSSPRPLRRRHAGDGAVAGRRVRPGVGPGPGPEGRPDGGDPPSPHSASAVEGGQVKDGVGRVGHRSAAAIAASVVGRLARPRDRVGGRVGRRRVAEEAARRGWRHAAGRRTVEPGTEKEGR